MYWFYSPDIASLTLPEEESAHCVQVLRAKSGDHITLTDGQGTLYEAEIVNPHRKHCTFRLLSQTRPEPLHTGHVHIAFAPTKSADRVEWMIEKGVEMGVDAFTPVLCRYSERKTLNIERLNKIIISAAKQSLRASFPTLNELTPFSRLVTSATETDKLIAHCIEGYAPTDNKQAMQHSLTRGNDVVILIGPEGDFSPEELTLALAHGWQPVSLGPSRLRTETAALVAAHTALLINE